MILIEPMKKVWGGFGSLLTVRERVMRVWSNLSTNRSRNNRMQQVIEERRDNQFGSYSISMHYEKTVESGKDYEKTVESGKAVCQLQQPVPRTITKR